MPLPARALNPLPAVTQLLTSGAALNPSNRYAACGPPARKATGMSRPIDADGTIRLSNPAAWAEPPFAVVKPPTVKTAAHSSRSSIDKSFISASLVHRSHRVELRNEPSTVDLLESDAHSGRALSGRIVADGGGLVDENQDHCVLSGRRYRCRSRHGCHGRNVLLLGPGSNDIADELRVLLTEAAGEPVSGGLQLLIHGFRLVRQDRDGGVAGGSNRLLCRRLGFPRRAVEPFQITHSKSKEQRQHRKYCDEQTAPRELSTSLGRRFVRVVVFGDCFLGLLGFLGVEQICLVGGLSRIGQVVAIGKVVGRRLVGDRVVVTGHREALLLRG